MAIERRFVPADAEMTVRDSDGALKPLLTGHAANFNEWSPVYGSDEFQFREQIDPGFFDDVLNENQDVVALFNHDSNIVLGRTTPGTLKLSKNMRGLRYEVDPPDTQLVKDMVIEPMRRRDVAGSSFAFELQPGRVGDKWERGADGVYNRTLLRAKRLYDVSVVTQPFYPGTDAVVALRSAAQADSISEQIRLSQEIVVPITVTMVEDRKDPNPTEMRALSDLEMTCVTACVAAAAACDTAIRAMRAQEFVAPLDTLASAIRACLFTESCCDAAVRAVAGGFGELYADACDLASDACDLCALACDAVVLDAATACGEACRAASAACLEMPGVAAEEDEPGEQVAAPAMYMEHQRDSIDELRMKLLGST